MGKGPVYPSFLFDLILIPPHNTPRVHTFFFILFKSRFFFFLWGERGQASVFVPLVFIFCPAYVSARNALCGWCGKERKGKRACCVVFAALCSMVVYNTFLTDK